ncbi:MAG: hypothetical protein ACYC1I_09690 [Acidimicrobiales bacterium]
MATTLTRKQITALAAELRTILVKIEEGDLDATISMRHRIEGSLTALDMVLGHSPESILERFQDREGGST